MKESPLEATATQQTKNIFLANMSHEIRTPMNAILGYSQILLRDKDLKPEHKKALEIILKSSDNLLEVINDMLFLTKAESEPPLINLIDFDLTSLLTDLNILFQNSCSSKSLSWDFKNFKNPFFVNADAFKIRQVLTKLIDNVIKHTDTGQIFFGVEKRENDWVEFTIKDTETGIPSKDYDSIFKTFGQGTQRVQKGSAGLGLAISQNLAKLMGGDISVDSPVEGGSVIALRLPLTQAKSKKPAEQNKKVIHLKNEYKAKALVVDDVKEDRELLSKLLESIGITVAQAENGEVSVEKYTQIKPDIIFMNIRMPIMDGFDAIDSIKENFPERELKIVVVSGSVLKKEQERFLSLGCKDIILKPFREEQIFSCIQRLLEVEFEYDRNDVNDRSNTTIDFSKVNISESIIDEIKKAAELNNLTGLECCLNLINPRNKDEENLLNKLVELMTSYDMEGINNQMDKLANAS